MLFFLLQNSLNKAILEDLRSNKENITIPVLQITLVKALSLMHYKGDDKITYARITVALPRLIAPAKRLLEKSANSFNLMDPSFYETNIDFDIRFYYFHVVLYVY